MMDKNSNDARHSRPETLLVGVKEVARLLSLGERTVWRLSGNGTLPRPIAIGGARRWEMSAIEAYVQRMKDNR